MLLLSSWLELAEGRPEGPPKAPDSWQRDAQRALSAVLGRLQAREEPEEADCALLEILPLRCTLRRRAGQAPSSESIHRHMEALAENLSLRTALNQAIRALARAGIDAIVYKGQDYLERIYGDLGGRPMADVDLLVRERDRAHAERALLASGFRSDRSCPREHEQKFCKDGLAIDLHHALLQPARMKIAHEELFERAQPAPFAEGAFVLEPTDALLVHCINQTVKGFYLPPSSYIELQALLEDADAEAAVARATRWHAKSALYSSLCALGEFGNARAAGLAARISLSVTRRAMLNCVAKGFATHALTRPKPSRATLLAIKTTLIDSPHDAVRFLPRWAAWALPFHGLPPPDPLGHGQFMS